MSNPFDKFDEPSGNPFDKFDAPPAKPKTTLRQDAIQMAKDAPAGLIRGAGSGCSAADGGQVVQQPLGDPVDVGLGELGVGGQ